CRAPTAFARDQLVAAADARTDDDRNEHSLVADGVGETRRRLRLEPAARLPRVRLDLVDPQVRELRPFGGTADEDFEPAAEAPALRRIHAATATAARRSTG